MLGDIDGSIVGNDLVEHPLEISMPWKMSSGPSKHKESGGGLMLVGLFFTGMGSKVGSNSRISWLRFSREISRSGSSQ